MVKDVRDGTICMKDYEGQRLEVARQIRTGLFMVRIDHLSNVDDYLNPDRPYHNEAMKALVIDSGIDVTNEDFLAKRPEDLFTPTASLAAASSSSTTVRGPMSTEEMAARIANIKFNATTGEPEELIPGKSFAMLF